jgi:hypothetical protein
MKGSLYWSIRFLGDNFEEYQFECEEENNLDNDNDPVDHEFLIPLKGVDEFVQVHSEEIN